jgi:hypothetical protein
LKFIEEDIVNYEKYEKEVLESIQHKKQSLTEQRDMLKAKIQSALDSDPSAGKTKSGGKSVNLPDIGSASLSGYRVNYVIENEEELKKQLGSDFIRTKEELMKKEVKDFLKDHAIIDKNKVILKSTGEVVKGVKVEGSRTFRVTLK